MKIIDKEKGAQDIYPIIFCTCIREYVAVTPKFILQSLYTADVLMFTKLKNTNKLISHGSS